MKLFTTKKKSSGQKNLASNKVRGHHTAKRPPVVKLTPEAKLSVERVQTLRTKRISINLGSVMHRFDLAGSWKLIGSVEMSEAETERLGEENNMIRMKNEILTEMIWRKKVKIAAMRDAVEKLQGFLNSVSLSSSIIQ